MVRFPTPKSHDTFPPPLCNPLNSGNRAIRDSRFCATKDGPSLKDKLKKGTN